MGVGLDSPLLLGEGSGVRAYARIVSGQFAVPVTVGSHAPLRWSPLTPAPSPPWGARGDAAVIPARR